MNEQRPLGRATLGALGVVYGDIGTSPLYALKETDRDHGQRFGGRARRAVADLLEPAVRRHAEVRHRDLARRQRRRRRHAVVARSRAAEVRHRGPVGRALRRARGTRHGDVLLRGADHAGDHGPVAPSRASSCSTPTLAGMVLPITLGIIVALFAFQRRGTARVGGLFGPIMVLWFGTLAALGVVAIVDAPEVLVAVSPSYAVALLATHPGVALTILGAVFLVLTGAEALVRGHGALREATGAARMARLGVAGAAAELLRSGRAAADCRRARREPVVRAGARVAAAGAGLARDGGRRSSLRKRRSRAPSR